MGAVLPRDAFDEDLGVGKRFLLMFKSKTYAFLSSPDNKLSFLNGFVEAAILQGGKRYVPNAARNLSIPTERVRPLNFEEYER